MKRSATQKSKAVRLENKYREALLKANDLPSVYAALKVTEESCPAKNLHKIDQELLDQARLTISYLMFQDIVEHCTLPRSMGGLAMNKVKTEQTLKRIFAAMGPSCWNSTEEDILASCRDMEAADVHKILPKLKQVGQDACAQVDALRKELQTVEATKVDDI